MTTRTWPYGTVLEVKVVERVIAGGARALICTEPKSGEGFVLFGDKSDAKPGDTGTITFTQGGPTGGYWKYSPAKDEMVLDEVTNEWLEFYEQNKAAGTLRGIFWKMHEILGVPGGVDGGDPRVIAALEEIRKVNAGCGDPGD